MCGRLLAPQYLQRLALASISARHSEHIFTSDFTMLLQLGWLIASRRSLLAGDVGFLH